MKNICVRLLMKLRNIKVYKQFQFHIKKSISLFNINIRNKWKCLFFTSWLVSHEVCIYMQNPFSVARELAPCKTSQICRCAFKHIYKSIPSYCYLVDYIELYNKCYKLLRWIQIILIHIIDWTCRSTEILILETSECKFMIWNLRWLQDVMWILLLIYWVVWTIKPVT